MKKCPLFIFLILHSHLFLKAQPTSSLEQHPEKGILPFNAPCTDCEEDLSKRTGNVREFFKKEKGGGKTIYRQQSLGDMNFKDKNGYWRTNDPRMIPEGPSVFAARQQVSPVVVDFSSKIMSITNGEKQFQFNKNICLVYINNQGSEINFGEGDWSCILKSENYSQTIFNVLDFYKDIDLQIICHYGSIETNFIIKNKLNFANGWLVVRQDINMSEGLHSDLTYTESIGNNKEKGIITINDQSGERYFWITKGNAFDANKLNPDYTEMPFTLNENQLDYFVPMKWLNQESTQYPVTLDPLVSSTITFPRSSIYGSGYSAVCDSFGCSYFMNTFPMPSNCQITAVDCYFAYVARAPCSRADGAFGISITSSLGSCTTPNFGFPLVGQGAVFYWPVHLSSLGHTYFTPCLLPSQCASYNVDFELKFRRCVQAGAGCDSFCIGPFEDWIMTVEGKTLEIAAIPSLVCGDTTTLSVGPLYGVGPYSILWSPSGDTTPTILVSPQGPTNYSVVVSDACGNSDTASQVVNAVPSFYNPALTILPNDTVCPGQQVTLTANTFADSLCRWYIYSDSLFTSSFDTTSVIGLMANDSVNNVLVKFYYRVDSLGSYCNFIDTINIMVQNPMAYFTLSADTTPYNYFTSNLSSWVAPLDYFWDWGDSSTSTGANPTHTYADTGSYIICLTVTDSAGCTNIYCDSSGHVMLTVNGQFGVGVEQAFGYESGISIYPNPATNTLAISSSRSAMKVIEIYNLLGTKVRNVKLAVAKNEITIDVSELGAGIYFVKVQSEKGSAVRKLVVE